MTKTLGYSRLGQAIHAWTFGSGSTKILALGGVHGDEKEGVLAAEFLLARLSQHQEPLPFEITLIPRANPDGVLLSTRKNASGIDLNRNLPSNDWTSEAANDRYTPGPFANSEPENQALVKFLDQYRPHLIGSFHSFSHTLINTNGDCRSEAEVISKKTLQPVEESIGYPTPGCLGTYAGLERGMPTLTIEILRGTTPEDIAQIHVPAFLEACFSFYHRRSSQKGGTR